jgi:hypothetical protein
MSYSDVDPYGEVSKGQYGGGPGGQYGGGPGGPYGGGQGPPPAYPSGGGGPLPQQYASTPGQNPQLSEMAYPPSGPTSPEPSYPPQPVFQAGQQSGYGQQQPPPQTQVLANVGVEKYITSADDPHDPHAAPLTPSPDPLPNLAHLRSWHQQCLIWRSTTVASGLVQIDSLAGGLLQCTVASDSAVSLQFCVVWNVSRLVHRAHYSHRRNRGFLRLFCPGTAVDCRSSSVSSAQSRASASARKMNGPGWYVPW